MRDLCIGLTLSMCLGLGACGNHTEDLIEGSYVGYFANGDLDDDIGKIDENDQIMITFFDIDACEGVEDCRELWADILFRGVISVRVLELFDVELSGPKTDVVEGITVKNLELTCKRCSLFGKHRTIKGDFSSDLESLELWAKGIGSIPLTRVDDAGAHE